MIVPPRALEWRARASGRSPVSVFYDMRNVVWSFGHGMLLDRVRRAAEAQGAEYLVERIRSFCVVVSDGVSKDVALEVEIGVPPRDSWAGELFSLLYSEALDKYIMSTEGSGSGYAMAW